MRSTRPRTRAGINSSIAELIAAYSPPIPAPVSARNDGVAHKVPRKRRQRRADEIDANRDEKQFLPPEPICSIAKEKRAANRACQVNTSRSHQPARRSGQAFRDA